MSDTAPPSARPSNTMASSKRENRNSSSALASSPGAAAKPVRKVHTILAPKGGCGKTYVASLIAQALQERGEPVVCFDTDRENASLRDIAALQAEPVSLFLPNSDEIDIHAMDGMTERMLREDAHFVLDNGATSFAPLSRYLVQDGIADAVSEAGKTMVVHTIVAGGQELIQTTRGFDSVASQFPASVDRVLWLNEHHGPVDGADGASFEQTPVYQKHKGRILAVVRLARQHPGTFGRTWRTCSRGA
jgi:CobQ/CobB/MinD/ParA nucleotide binding domain